MDRRRFLQTGGTGAAGVMLGKGLMVWVRGDEDAAGGWQEPGREFSLCPFWFWNDELTEEELDRQLEDFQAHGVHAFVIHPRVGLPRSIGWLSERMVHYIRYAIEGAEKRGMLVVLYDEGMYPSGSSSGQVVKENPAYRTRGLFAIDLEKAKPGGELRGIEIGADGRPVLKDGQNLVAVVRRKMDGHRIAVVDRAIGEGYSRIRGLHFVEADPPRREDRKEVAEEKPPGGDILNPEAVKCFIRLVYQRCYDEFKQHFGRTVQAIFTDEPSFLARGAEPGAVAGTTGILKEVNRILGYDFTEFLPCLWYGDQPEADRYRREWRRALAARLEKTFYAPISRWCREHGVALTGHPAGPDDIGALRHFQIPGQDIVWRSIEPGRGSGVEGPQSTQGKCASSAMVHLGRRRNANEYCGAYGHDFTFEEMKWLTGWLAARGCNLLIPHAFYYSVRGPRVDERPPDVGPHSAWWDEYPGFAKGCRRLCWLNTDSRQVCAAAILGRNDYLPWRAAKVCYQHQRDFNYLEARHLWEDARVSEKGIGIRAMHYAVLIIEEGEELPEKAEAAIEKLEKAGRVIPWSSETEDGEFLRRIERLSPADVRVTPKAAGLRVRHVIKEGADYYLLFNEGETDIEVGLDLAARGERELLDPYSEERAVLTEEAPIRLLPHGVRVLKIRGATKTGTRGRR